MKKEAIHLSSNSEYFNHFKRLTEDRLGNQDSLSNRKKVYTEIFDLTYNDFRELNAKHVLSETDAITTITNHTKWMDQWIQFSWWFSVSEQSLLLKGMLQMGAQKLPYLKKTIPQRQQKRDELSSLLSSENEQGANLDPAERTYYSNQLKDLTKEISDLETELALLNEVINVKNDVAVNDERFYKIFCIFARGGYGRNELTFSSDIDLGYCLNPAEASGLELLVLQEIIKRMEELFQGISLDLASQYFELGEDLSRFGRLDMLHTIPSILEGRLILGHESVLKGLRNQFLQICPPEKAIRFLKKQMDALESTSTETLRIKEDFGGIRHIQYVLWMVLLVDNIEHSNSAVLLGYLAKKGWISENDLTKLLQALEFYYDLRNFIGLYEFYQDAISKVDFEGSLQGKKVHKDYLDSTVTMAYLKLKHRFVTVDYLDRFRLNSVSTVSILAQSIVRNMLNRTIVEVFPGFKLVKHLGSNKIIGLYDDQYNYQHETGVVEYYEDFEGIATEQQLEVLRRLITNAENIFELFLYIGKTGNLLSQSLVDGLSALTDELYQSTTIEHHPRIKRFVYRLFTSENASVAIRQMIEISAAMSRDGHAKTFLGLIIPEVNQMRFVLRNLEIHEWPLCIHSMKVLKQVEREIENSQNNEPELWKFTNENDIFALKWAAFFHDVGKINPYRNHERLGPILSTDMLKRLGWSEQEEVMEMVRLLIANHQSVVRFSQLATYLDLGILKFFELAQRNPRKVLLLYLINLSDFKSVNSEMSKRAAHLENFFEKTMSILREFKLDQATGTLTDIVNDYLDRVVSEKRISVMAELLLRQCININLEDVVLIPLTKISPKEAEELERYRNEMEDSLVFLKLSELDEASLTKHRFRFIQTIQQVLSDENLEQIVSPLSRSLNWFFTAIPNRYLLSSSIESLTSQLQELDSDSAKEVQLSYIPGEKGEYDSILFHFTGNPQIQAKIAYALSWHGVNIENGKINKVIYDDGTEGFIGFFKISTAERRSRLSSKDLENVIQNLLLPPLNPPPISTSKKLLNVQTQFFVEKDKGYQIVEEEPDKFDRHAREYTAIKVSLTDAPFAYYKILRSFEAVGVVPQQVTITTIGNQIIDYFYITKMDRKRIREDEFLGVLQKYINAEIRVD